MGVGDLRLFPWSDYGVVFAVLFGSRVWGRVVKGDWDITVWLADVNRDLDLQYALARFLHVRDEDVDLVILNNYEYLPCSLIIDALGRGRVIYYRDLDEYLDIKLKVLAPCLDFMIDAEKLDLLGTQIGAVTRKWVR
ncbi:nucleotidyltransferase domain-containing protein [Vulcanisaeta sp. JCM 16159]|uniref:nucleotidyltransferase domain-containing protein n=1 Tax=Vulcanisaeta sp. JCM 16159 TaxID=1295371 RepID=UPI0006D07580|nr:nucleotidyltransferase domain-containing protein [Vulcanisaeta sp. JCM 16159]